MLVILNFFENDKFNLRNFIEFIEESDFIDFIEYVINRYFHCINSLPNNIVCKSNIQKFKGKSIKK